MARKRSALFFAVQSILKFRGFRRPGRAIAIALSACFGLILALSLPVLTADPPASPQKPPVSALLNAEGSTAIALVQQGQTLYNQGNFSEAAEVWEQAARSYRTAGDWLNEAMALSNLSLTYQQLGEWDRAEEAIAQSLQNLPESERPGTSADTLRILAQSLDIYGKLQLQRGRSAAAIATWKRTAALYQQLQNPEQQRQSFINQAEALQAIGLYPRACDTLLQGLGQTPDCQNFLDIQPSVEEPRISDALNQLISRQQAQPATLTTVTGLRSLADVLRQLGSLEGSAAVLRLSYNLAEQLGSPEALTAILLSQGHTATAQGNRYVNENAQRLLVDFKWAFNSLTDLTPNDSPEPTPEQVVLNPFNPALSYYEQVINRQPESDLNRLEAQLNSLHLLLSLQKLWPQQVLQLSPEQAQWSEVEKWLTQEKIEPLIPKNLTAELQRFPRTVKAIYAKIQWADHLQQLAWKNAENSPLACTGEDSSALTQGRDILNQAIADARALGNPRVESYAIGSLGHLYEQQAQVCPNSQQRNRWLTQAEAYTNQALALLTVYETPTNSDQDLDAQQITYADDRDLSYRWQWQLGRILNFEGKTQAATQIYQQTFQTLSNLRRDLAAINQNVQFSFQEEIAPFYRQFAQLLLAGNPPGEIPASNQNWQETIQVIDALQLAELENFLQSPCFVSTDETLLSLWEKGALNRNEAIVYTLVSELDSDRSQINFIVLNSSDRTVHKYAQIISTAELNRSLIELKDLFYSKALEEITTQGRTLREITEKLEKNLEQLLPELSNFYQLLIAPIKPQLQGISTLVFVLDPKLQNIPISALYDGEQYLVQQYEVAILTPGLRLGDTESLMDKGSLKALAAGVSKSQKERDLEQVETELKAIKAILPNSKILLNERFTKTQVQRELRSEFPIVHFATHGEFSSNPRQTWILAGGDRLITVDEFSELLQFNTNSRFRNNIQLLVLSACRTAQGDDRAILGLAGVALRAGARSTIATLWNVEDNSAATVMTQFYQDLAQGERKSEALRHAQILLLQDPTYQQYRHPVYWAPYILVGNWR